MGILDNVLYFIPTPRYNTHTHARAHRVITSKLSGLQSGIQPRLRPTAGPISPTIRPLWLIIARCHESDQLSAIVEFMSQDYCFCKCRPQSSHLRHTAAAQRTDFERNTNGVINWVKINYDDNNADL